MCNKSYFRYFELKTLCQDIYLVIKPEIYPGNISKGKTLKALNRRHYACTVFFAQGNCEVVFDQTLELAMIASLYFKMLAVKEQI